MDHFIYGKMTEKIYEGQTAMRFCPDCLSRIWGRWEYVWYKKTQAEEEKVKKEGAAFAALKKCPNVVLRCYPTLTFLEVSQSRSFLDLVQKTMNGHSVAIVEIL